MKKVVIFLILFFLFSSVVSANEEYSEDFRYSVGLDDTLLPDDIDLRDPAELQQQLEMKNLLAYLKSIFKKTFASAVKILMPGVAMTLLSVWIRYCCNTIDSSRIKTVLILIISVSTTLLAESGLQKAVEMIQGSLESMKIFCTACIPSFSVVMISAGENAGAGVFSSLMILLGQVGSFISSNLLMPLIHIYLAISACSVAGDEYNFSAIAQYIRRFFVWCIGLAMAAFRLILNMKIGVAAAGDLMAKKYIKSAVAGLIPIVGSTLSQGVDGLFSVATGAKTAFAIGGVLILVSIMLPALLTTGLFGFCWSLCKWLSSFLEDQTVMKIANVLSNGFYILLALGGGVTMMGIFSFFGLLSRVA